jgi:hypothetical protein
LLQRVRLAEENLRDARFDHAQVAEAPQRVVAIAAFGAGRRPGEGGVAHAVADRGGPLLGQLHRPTNQIDRLHRVIPRIDLRIPV